MKAFWTAACLMAATLAASGTARAQGCPTCGVGGPDGGHGFGSGWGHGPCPWYVDNCAQIPRRAQPASPGTYTNRWAFLQAQKAELDDFVIYQNQWFRGGTELGPMGRYYLDLIANRMGRHPMPIVIETSRDDRLDEARREVLITLLERRGLKDPTRVIVAFPIAEGLLGEEAPRIASFYLSGGGYGGGFGGLGGQGGFSGFTQGPAFGR
jgi:hypothetical protein